MLLLRRFQITKVSASNSIKLRAIYVHKFWKKINVKISSKDVNECSFVALSWSNITT